MTNAITATAPVSPRSQRAPDAPLPGQQQLEFAATLGFLQAASGSAQPAEAIPLQQARNSESKPLIESSVDRRAADEARSQAKPQPNGTPDEPSLPTRERTQTSREDPTLRDGTPATGKTQTAESKAIETAAAKPQSAQPSAEGPQAGSAPASTPNGGVHTSAASGQPAASIAPPAAPAAASVQQAANTSTSRNDGATLLDRLGGKERSGPVFKLKPPVPSKQGAELAQQVSRGLAQLLRNQGGTLSLKLAPESLGAVQIDLKLSSGRVEAVIQANDEVARGLLESQVSRLRGALEARGVTVDRLEVRLLAEPSASDDTSGGAAESPSQDAKGHAQSGRDDSGAERRQHANGGDRFEQIERGEDAATDRRPRGAWFTEPGAEATIRLDTVV